jgi:hypothetical protein
MHLAFESLWKKSVLRVFIFFLWCLFFNIKSQYSPFNGFGFFSCLKHRLTFYQLCQHYFLWSIFVLRNIEIIQFFSKTLWYPNFYYSLKPAIWGYYFIFPQSLLCLFKINYVCPFCHYYLYIKDTITQLLYNGFRFCYFKWFLKLPNDTWIYKWYLNLQGVIMKPKYV